MTFPTATTAQEAYFTILAYARQVKQATASQIALAQAGTCSGADILNYLTLLASANASMQQAAAVTGVAAYAQSASGSTSNIVTDYQSMATAISNVVTWVQGNFPNSGGTPAYLLVVSFNADGTQAARVFSAPTLSGYVTQLQALAATIN
ncbi:MAG TPA: hypothetical protein VJQ47_06915 [Steroidobacteraceae bacterium]|nr:hypothetical protein [Steroidobacteraceae bacterium]